MATSDTVVLIVGGGAAGVTAAIGLAKQKIPVVVIEGGIYPGAENWSGAIYFCESLARPEILGDELLAQSAVERRITRRGVMATDGQLATGLSVHSKPAFEHCYSVLRPIFDHDLAQKARLFGAEILSGTQALALIRDGDTVRGVLTDRGPIYADVVFLAEGDASNLVSREGLETKPTGSDGLARPEFLQGIKEVLDLPSSTIEERFGLPPGEGCAFEILLRNTHHKGVEFPLNAGAFLYTNRDSLSLGLVAPLHNMKQTQVPHNVLMEWLKSLPALEGLLDGATSKSFGTKLIRGGGMKELPRMVMPGLAVGGAASGLGVDFPCPNFTGPASFMGATFSKAVGETVRAGEGFSEEALKTRYLEPLSESHYWKDVDHLKEWPEFVSSTREFFGRQVDLVTSSVDIATRAEGSRRREFARNIYGLLPFSQVKSFTGDSLRSLKALGFMAGWGGVVLRCLVMWTINLVIGWWPRKASSGATVTPHLWAPDADRRRPIGGFLKYLYWKLSPGVADSMHHLFKNDGTPLAEKIPVMRRSILDRLNWVDVILLGGWKTVAYLGGGLLHLFGSGSSRRLSDDRAQRSALQDLAGAKEKVDHDQKLSWITYRSDHHSHIHFHAAYDKKGLPSREGSSVFRVCPARVYKEERDLMGTPSVAVLHENCIRCETCWRADDERVDWGRTRGQKLVFETYSSADAWMRESREAASLADSSREATSWKDVGSDETNAPVSLPPDLKDAIQERLHRAIRHGRAALAWSRHAPPVLSGADQHRFRELAETAIGETLSALESLRGSVNDDGLQGRMESIRAWEVLAREHLKARRFFHVEADLLLLLQVHLPDLLIRTGVDAIPVGELLDPAGGRRRALRAMLEVELTRDLIAESEEAREPTDGARRVLLRIVAGLVDPQTGSPVPPASPARNAALEELARLSAGLAVVMANHLLVLDLVSKESATSDPPEALDEIREDLRLGRVLGGLLRGEFALDAHGQLEGKSPAALLGGVGVLLVPAGEGAFVLTPEDGRVRARITGGLGLLSAGPGDVNLESATPRAMLSDLNTEEWLRLRGPWDLVAVARGMAKEMEERALDHAGSRVQFPGLFKDARGRDGLAKFGAIQKMLSEIAQATAILDALRGRVGSGRLAGALALDLLGPSPRSVSYLAGQVLGGTAYSEEDSICRAFRDAVALTRVPMVKSEVEHDLGQFILNRESHQRGQWPTLSYRLDEPRSKSATSPLLSSHLNELSDALAALDDRIAKADVIELNAWPRAMGRLGLHVLGVRALADRVVAHLDAASPDAVLPEVFVAWVARTTLRARRLARRIGDGKHLVALGQRLLSTSEAIEGIHEDAPSYTDYMKADEQYQSGGLIVENTKTGSLFSTPELFAADPELRQLMFSTRAIWRERFGSDSYPNLPYTRVVEQLHHIPLEDVEWLKREGYFRTVIPSEFGGQDWTKAGYYAVCNEMMRSGDPTQAIVVMGSTSIGTTPILIGLKGDLPSAKAALDSLLAGTPPLAEWIRQVESVASRLETTSKLADGDAQTLASLSSEMRSKMRAKVFRLLFGDLGKALGKAARGAEAPAVAAALRKWLHGLSGWEQVVQTEFKTLKRRESAHGFFLNLISSGRISCFALTEPSAGSDTARMRTRATLTSVPVIKNERGFYTFHPEGAEEGVTRNLFTHDSFVVDEGELFFIKPDRHRVPVVWQDFDRGADGNLGGAESRFRYVELDGQRIPIHDLGTVVTEDGELRYPYYRVQGAKMWITNASTSGVMILYARTERGPTGFMLDAHAEGLVISKDEHKMGQRGSATNELALNDVRIPKDQIIGLEGRGQENALETLNIGRAGLAVCCTGLMRGVLDDVREGLLRLDPTPEQYAELGRIALDLVAAETIAYRLVGLSDHKKTKSFRMESALAKAFASEALHRVLTRAEGILDAGWALADRELEKRRRDARVITIYEGTSEIQRFLLLKDMMDVMPLPEEAPRGAGTQHLDQVRAGWLQHAQQLRSDLGSAAWQQAHLQPWAFQLVEEGVRTALLAAMIDRLSLCKRLMGGPKAEAHVALLDQAVELFGRDAARSDELEWRQFADERRRLMDGRDGTDQTIADRVLLRGESGGAVRKQSRLRSDGDILRVAVLLDPEPIIAPNPRVDRGHPAEHAWELTDSDRAVLAEVMKLRSTGEVQVHTFAAGRLAAIDCLEESLALGADMAWLLNTGRRLLLAPDVAGALTDVIRAREGLAEERYDLVLAASDRAALALPLARRLGMTPVVDVNRFDVDDRKDCDPVFRIQVGGTGKPIQLVGPLLMVVNGTMTSAEMPFSSDGWRRARGQQVHVIDFDPEAAHEISVARGGDSEGTAAAEEIEGPLEVRRAAELFVDVAGVTGTQSEAGPFEGETLRIPAARYLDDLGSLAVVELSPEDDLSPGAVAAVCAARSLARLREERCGVLVISGEQDVDAMRPILGSILGLAPEVRIGVIPWPELIDGSYIMRAQLLEGCLKGYEGAAFFAQDLRLAALMAGEGRALEKKRVTLLDGVDRITQRGELLEFSGSRADGRLRFLFEAPLSAASCHAVVNADLTLPELNGTLPTSGGSVSLLDEIPFPSQVDQLAGMLTSAAQDVGGSLQDAEFVIDVGYGVGTRDGIEEVIEPLQQALVEFGVKKVMIGATRKVTMDLGILPDSAQIGQTGVPVNPRVMICVGVSGAPQHMDYVGNRGVIFAFNKDPDAPIMTLNATRPKPIVYPILGDLFTEVPRFIAALNSLASDELTQESAA